MRQTRIFLFLFIVPLSILASDTTRTTAIIVDIQKTFRAEYCACTGDSMQSNPRVIIAWKKKQNQTVQSPLYQDALKRYKKLFESKKPIRTCDVIVWMNQGKESQTAAEKKITRELLARQDSLDLAAELAQNPSSPCDFALIPFGVYQETFIEIFARYYPQIKLLNIGTYLYAQQIPWEGRALTIAYYFNRAGKFYKYALESENHPADSLNTAIRPYTELFGNVFSQRVGKPDRTGTVAFFDIKDNLLSLCDEWEAKTHHVYSGLSRSNYRYYAKAVVSNVALDDRSQRQAEKIIVTENGKETHYISDGPIIP